MGDMIKFDVEKTDTYGGEANYSWVERTTIDVSREASQAQIMRLAKRAVGMAGVRGRTTQMGGIEGYEFRPYGACVVLFVTFHDE